MILTYGYWQRRFGGDPSVIGRQLTVDSRPAEIVGVMPEGFRFLDIKPQAEVILPIRLNRNGLAIAGFGLRGLARLKPGVTVADANADIARMLPIWLNAWPIPPGTVGRQAIENWRITPALQPLKDEVVGGVGDMLWVLMGTIGIVLLIACANVANLMLVRSDGRRHEFAVRTALGAGRGQIARDVLIEGLVLALTGGALGVVLAQAGLKVLLATAPDTLPRLEEISLDPRVVAFAIVISFVVEPAVRRDSVFACTQRESPIGSAARGASASRERQRTRNTLVVVQVALALVLLISSGLMIRTFQALQNVDPGFADAATLQTARVWIPPQQVRGTERFTRMQHEILDKIASLPGVRAAGFASSVPMEPNRAALSGIWVDGQRACGRHDPAGPPNQVRVARLLRRDRYAPDRRTRHHVERHLPARRGSRSSPRTSLAKCGGLPQRRWASASGRLLRVPLRRCGARSSALFKTSTRTRWISRRRRWCIGRS